MQLTLLMARHGQTDLNIDDRLAGRLDLPLNATGISQAESLAVALPDHIDAIVASPMQRARQTAETVARARALPLRLEPAFRERAFGVFEGLTADEAATQYPALFAANAAFRWDIAPTGAEPTRAVIDRVAEGLGDLRGRCMGKTVLLVSHGFVVRCLRYLVDRLDDSEFFNADRIGNGDFLVRHLN